MGSLHRAARGVVAHGGEMHVQVVVGGLVMQVDPQPGSRHAEALRYGLLRRGRTPRVRRSSTQRGHGGRQRTDRQTDLATDGTDGASPEGGEKGRSDFRFLHPRSKGEGELGGGKDGALPHPPCRPPQGWSDASGRPTFLPP